jgi:hypothetical protein
MIAQIAAPRQGSWAILAIAANCGAINELQLLDWFTRCPFWSSDRDPRADDLDEMSSDMPNARRISNEAGASCIDVAARFVASQPDGPRRSLARHCRRRDGYCAGCLHTPTAWPCVLAVIAQKALARWPDGDEKRPDRSR